MIPPDPFKGGNQTIQITIGFNLSTQHFVSPRTYFGTIIKMKKDLVSSKQANNIKSGDPLGKKIKIYVGNAFHRGAISGDHPVWPPQARRHVGAAFYTAVRGFTRISIGHHTPCP